MLVRYGVIFFKVPWEMKKNVLKYTKTICFHSLSN